MALRVCCNDGTQGYTDLLDSSGTFFAVAKVAGLTDSRGNLPLARQNMAYLADALAMMAGGWLKKRPRL